MENLPVYAVLAAAGSGTRLGFDTPKAFVELGGRTLLERSLDGLAASHAVDHVVVMVSPDMKTQADELTSSLLNRATWAGMTVRTTIGGAERFDSVYAGLEEIERELSWSVDCVQNAEAADALVLVHDAARCLTPAAMIRQLVKVTVAGLASGKDEHSIMGAVPALPVSDTIKVVGGSGLIEDSPPRATLRAVQTPQAFLFSSLLDANRKYLAQLELGRGTAADVTDDASVMALAGHRIATVAGDEMALKITTPQDYEFCKSLLASPQQGEQGVLDV